MYQRGKRVEVYNTHRGIRGVDHKNKSGSREEKVNPNATKNDPSHMNSVSVPYATPSQCFSMQALYPVIMSTITSSCRAGLTGPIRPIPAPLSSSAARGFRASSLPSVVVGLSGSPRVYRSSPWSAGVSRSELVCVSRPALRHWRSRSRRRRRRLLRCSCTGQTSSLHRLKLHIAVQAALAAKDLIGLAWTAPASQRRRACNASSCCKIADLLAMISRYLLIRTR